MIEARTLFAAALLPLLCHAPSASAHASGAPAVPSAATAASAAPAEAAIIARLRKPLHDIELHSRAVLASGRMPPDIVTFLRVYAELRDHLDTLVYKGDYVGAVATARKDLMAVKAVAQKARLHDFDEELARCEAILGDKASPGMDAAPQP